ncbi:MAG: hypothetical protein L6R28_12045 [Planctomycetes bacterium]|nr:hypothetical protein [Planctomycetota bacterium]
MTQAPRGRPWFQLHLSTCVVLMLAAGVLVGANFVPSTRAVVWIPFADHPSFSDSGSGNPNADGWGWPMTFRVLNVLGEPLWRIEGVVFDVLVALGIIFSLGFAIEWRIRRRADDEAEFRESIG